VFSRGGHAKHGLIETEKFGKVILGGKDVFREEILDAVQSIDKKLITQISPGFFQKKREGHPSQNINNL